MSCPSPTQLEQLLADRLDLADADRLRRHITDCVECQTSLDRMTSGPALAATAAAAPGEIAGLLGRLRELEPSSEPAARRRPTTDDWLLPAVMTLGVILLLGLGAFLVVSHRRQQALAAAAQRSAELAALHQATLAQIEATVATLEKDPVAGAPPLDFAPAMKLLDSRPESPQHARLALAIGRRAQSLGDDATALATFRKAAALARATGQRDLERDSLEAGTAIRSAGLAEWEALTSYWNEQVRERPDDGNSRRKLAASWTARGERLRATHPAAAATAFAAAVAVWEELARREPDSPFIKAELDRARALLSETRNPSKNRPNF